MTVHASRSDQVMLFCTCYLRLGGVCKFMPPGKVDVVHEYIRMKSLARGVPRVH